MTDRTLASPSGYFMLYSEITSIFETPRIFLNQNGQPLDFLPLTAKDLIDNQKLTETIIDKMSKDKKKYNNHSNFLNMTKTKGLHAISLDQRYRLWLPFIIEYLRNNPQENKYVYFADKNEAAISTLCKNLDLHDFIMGINTIFSELSTPKCADYHTFISSDQYKIFVRCSDDSTDIIILNLDPKQMKTINDLDIEKIALLSQERKFPYPDNKKINLSSPLDNNPICYADSYYAHCWRVEKNQAQAFDASYNRVTGREPNHQTNLYLGYGLKCELSEKSSVKVVTHLKTEQQIQNEIFRENKNMKLELSFFSRKNLNSTPELNQGDMKVKQQINDDEKINITPF